ncbi:MAG: HAD-IIA family hydrolase [archaeon]|nr:MAG: HAD-IIA family hydrolase [archaeon]
MSRPPTPRRGLFRDKKLFLFDLDGVFYKGKETRIRLGGSRAVEAIRGQGKKIFVLTNNSTDSIATIHARLQWAGVDVKRSEILSSSLLTAEYIRDRFGPSEYFLVGEAGLQREMDRCGHVRTDSQSPACVVVGLDRKVTYAKLDRASRAVRGGAKLIATHSARLYMYTDGPAMATGPLVKAIEYASGRRAVVIGKPSPLMFRAALTRARCSAKDAVMLGDQVETDIIGAKAAGIDPVLVTTGVDADDQGEGAVATLSNVDALAPLV